MLAIHNASELNCMETTLDESPDVVFSLACMRAILIRELNARLDKLDRLARYARLYLKDWHKVIMKKMLSLLCSKQHRIDALKQI